MWCTRGCIASTGEGNGVDDVTENVRLAIA